MEKSDFDRHVDNLASPVGQQARSRLAGRREHKRRQTKRAELEERQGQIIDLQDRNAKVVNAVDQLTKGGSKAQPYQRGGVYRKVTVVVGEAKQTKVTPDHIIVCGVSSETTNNGKRATFDYSIVPRETVASFVEQPHTLHDNSRPELKPVRAEVSRTNNELGKAGYDAKYEGRLSYGDWLRRETSRVSTMERSFPIILESAANQELNPHLADSVSALKEQLIEARNAFSPDQVDQADDLLTTKFINRFSI